MDYHHQSQHGFIMTYHDDKGRALIMTAQAYFDNVGMTEYVFSDGRDDYDYDEMDSDELDSDLDEDQDHSMCSDRETEQYDFFNDPLLRLAVGVHSYLADANKAGHVVPTSPLHVLQYKIYSYLKQRANDITLQTEAPMPSV